MSSLLSPEDRAQIELWRRKAVDGSITLDEMRQAVALMRQGRIGASVSSTRARTAKAPIDADSLLDDLEKL